MAGRFIENNKKQQIHVLVAEDDSFQRLALMDILSLCHYEVTAVENGRLARDELLKEDSNYDVVLLDLMMPEMDGLELLCLMKGNEKLKDIPVIMMSSDSETESVASCLSQGAKDYLIKPIRVQNVKGLANFVEVKQKKKKEQALSLSQYEKCGILGRGAAGSVELVRRTTDGELFALKIIPMHFMSPQEKKMAENEITLLKVLVGPTIIRYFESFIENDSINIVMEYAEKGSLSDRIQEHKNLGKKISTEQILYWMAQLIIAIMLMHSKNILHRDIKTQNLFLTKGDIIKMGDFGIAKDLGTQGDYAKTFLGTPYFMSPEVCKGEQYGQKADIWALGCALYEMVTLRRPFQHEHLTGVFELIISKDYDALPEDTDPDIKMLVFSMLQKDPARRPTVWELGELKCIKDCINRFVEEHNCRESVEVIFKIDQNSKKPANTTSSTNSLPTLTPSLISTMNPNNLHTASQVEDSMNKTILETQKPQTTGHFNIDNLEDISNTIRESIKLRDKKLGFFSTIEKVFSGKDLYDWFIDHYPSANTDLIMKTGNDMIMHNYIHCAHGNQKNYLNSDDIFYRFQMDKPNIAANMIKIWTGEVKNALNISVELIKKVKEVIKEIKDDKMVAETDINAEKLKTTKTFTKFQEMACELQKVSLGNLPEDEKLCFWLNMVQVMAIHKSLKQFLEDLKNSQSGANKGFLAKIYSFIPGWSSKESFFYTIAGMNFTFEEVQHGILRGNQKCKQDGFFGFDKADPRLSLVQKKDPRRICLWAEEESLTSKKLETFLPTNLNEILAGMVTKFVSSGVYYDSSEGEIILPKIIEKYKDDFGSNPVEIVSWFVKNMKNINASEVIKGVKDGQIVLTYNEN